MGIIRPSARELQWAAEALRAGKSVSSDMEKAKKILSRWRALHSAPWNAFGEFIRSCVGKNDLVAQRLKRMPSIIKELRRFPGMDVDCIHDMAGARVITENVGNMATLCATASKGTECLKLQDKTYDYLKEPKEDGYRGIQLFFRYNSEERPESNGLWVELQIQSRLQHAWSMAVEALGTIEGIAFKPGEGDNERKEFFRVASALFALEEGTPLPKSCAEMGKDALIARLSELERKLEVIKRMETAAAILQDNIKDDIKGDVHAILILSNADGKTSANVLTFDKSVPILAEKTYAGLEYALKDDPSSNAVLMYSNDVRKIREEFPSYFLDTEIFVQQIKKYLK